MIPLGKVVRLIRKLAKTGYWQLIYSQSKEINDVGLFENRRDFSEVQTAFLSYLAFYYNLYLDVAMGEIEDIVFKDEIYEDGYILYKNKKDRDDVKKGAVSDKSIPNIPNIPKSGKGINRLTQQISNQNKWVFKRKD